MTKTSISDSLSAMENTDGWKYLAEFLKKREDDLVSYICTGTGDQHKDDLNRGELSCIRSIFDLIQNAHNNKQDEQEEV